MNKNKKLFIFLFIVIIIFAAVFLFNNSSNNLKGVTVNKSRFLMDTKVDIKAHGIKAEEAVKAAFKKVETIENKMSKTVKTSDIYKVNEIGTKEWVKVDKNTFKVVKKALEYAEKTNGKFDPTIGPLVELWGIGTAEAQIPEAEEINNAKNLVNYRNLLLDSDNYQLKLSRKKMTVDLGSIVKGYAADEVYKVLESYDIKSAFVNLGGNVLTLGRKKDGSLWKIGIQDPRKHRGSVMAALEIKDKTVVTSGNYERYFEKDGVIYHHILNPETGKPTQNNLLSVSIITKNSAEADALSTSVYIMGLDKGRKLIESRSGIEAIFVTESNEIYLSSGLKEKVEIMNSDFKIIEGE